MGMGIVPRGHYSPSCQGSRPSTQFADAIVLPGGFTTQPQPELQSSFVVVECCHTVAP